jgi:type IV pilus biogenesis/stability protein PilW
LLHCGWALLLAGCTATGSGPGSGQGAQQPTSSKPAENEQQQRAKVHTELGSLYMLDGRSAIALEEARIALAADSNYAPAYNLLGLTHMVLNEPRLAEDNFEKALRLAPGDPEINNNFGWFLCQNGRERRSIDYFMAAGKNPLYTTPTKPFTNAGICAMLMKDDKAAEEYLAIALAALADQHAGPVLARRYCLSQGALQRSAAVDHRHRENDGAQCRSNLAGLAHRAQAGQPRGGGAVCLAIASSIRGVTRATIADPGAI